MNHSSQTELLQYRCSPQRSWAAHILFSLSIISSLAWFLFCEKKTVVQEKNKSSIINGVVAMG
jgi:hypothetical protein